LFSGHYAAGRFVLLRVARHSRRDNPPLHNKLCAQACLIQEENHVKLTDRINRIHISPNSRSNNGRGATEAKGVDMPTLDAGEPAFCHSSITSSRRQFRRFHDNKTNTLRLAEHALRAAICAMAQAITQSRYEPRSWSLWRNTPISCCQRARCKPAMNY